MAARRVVVDMEVGQLPFQVTGIPEQHMVEEFSPHRPDEPLHKGVRQWHMGYGFDCVDLQKPKVGGPPMRLEERIMIGTEVSRGAPTVMATLNMRQRPGASTAPQCTPSPTMRRVNWSMTTRTQ